MSEEKPRLSGEKQQGGRMDPAMSLVGKLEDLSLGEILQIVSLSKRSGLLNLEGPLGEANIYIKDGIIIYAGRSDEKEGLLSLLVHHGIIEVSELEKIRERLEFCDHPKDLKGLISEVLGVSQDSFQRVLKKRVEEIMFSLFSWEEGTFSFQLIGSEEGHPLLDRVSALFLDQGINAQFMVMEGARRKDEMARVDPLEQTSPAGPGDFFENGGALDAPSEDRLIAEIEEFSVPSTMPSVPRRVSKVVLVVSEDSKLSMAVEGPLREQEVSILSIEDSANALSKIQELRSHDIHPCLVTDLRSPGITDGIALGGLDLVTTLWDLGLNLPTVITVEGEVPEGLREKLSGVDSISLQSMNPSGFESAVEFISSAIGMQKAAESQKVEFYDIQGELSDDLAGLDMPFDDLGSAPLPTLQETHDPYMDKLASYVSELNREDVRGEITLLTLRFATEFFSRAVLFLVRKVDLKGLGQFGVDLGEGENADSVVRTLVLPIEEKSLFSRVINTQQSFRGVPMEGDMDSLFLALGGKRPNEVYVGPVVSMGKVAVVLYADDCQDEGGLGPTNSLDIFLSHAGLALDRSFLEMKLKANRDEG